MHVDDGWLVRAEQKMAVGKHKRLTAPFTHASERLRRVRDERRVFGNQKMKGTQMKNGKLNGKVAVVTGASKGIGADIAKQFAAEGAAVVVNYASSKEGADRVVDQIAKRGGRAVAVQANVAKKADIERLFS